MKSVFWIGVVLIVLGLASLVIPIRHSEREGISAGNVSVGIQTQNSDRVSPVVSTVLILGGAGTMIVAKSRK